MAAVVHQYNFANDLLKLENNTIHLMKSNLIGITYGGLNKKNDCNAFICFRQFIMKSHFIINERELNNIQVDVAHNMWKILDENGFSVGVLLNWWHLLLIDTHLRSANEIELNYVKNVQLNYQTKHFKSWTTRFPYMIDSRVAYSISK